MQIKQALELGLVLDRVLKVLQFDQSLWIKEYIDLDTSLRQEALMRSDEDLPKLLNNSFFGKCCEDVRKYKIAVFRIRIRFRKR